MQYLQGTGVPGTGGDTAIAPVGSIYTDNSTGSTWTKSSAGSGAYRWQRLASETYVNTTGIMPDGATTLNFVNGLLVSVAPRPDGSNVALTWSGGVLQSITTTRGTTARTVTLTWSGGVLQTVTTTTITS